LLGIAQANLKNSDVAINAFRQATKLEPANDEYCLNLTRELMDLSRYDEAIAAIQAGLAANPKSYALHLRLGAVYLAAARYPDAEKSFRELVDANDPLPISYIGLAQVLMRTGHDEDAVAELTAAEQKLGPSFLLAYFRGLALKRAAKPSDAVSAFTEAIHLNSSSAEAHRDLGSTLLALGRTDEAIAQLKQSLGLGPNDVRTRRLLTHAYARSGDIKTAREYMDPEKESPVPAPDLQEDFILPSWQYPSQDKRD
jgi:tetratricopeptide (TPR) repeat protein